MRQIGVGTQAGAIVHQLFYGEWLTGSLSGPLARIKVDEKNCFGMIEWKAVREAASRFLPKHTEAAVWKHRNVTSVEQEGLSPKPQDRGGPADGICPSTRESGGQSYQPHSASSWSKKSLEDQSAAAVHDEIGQWSLERLLPGFTEDSVTEATLSASQSRIGFKRAQDIAAPAHLGALIAGNPRIHGMIRDAVFAGLLP